MNILYGFDRGTDLHIDMTVILCRKVGIIRNDTSVVECMSVTIGIGTSIVGPCILWISILSKVGLITKRLRITFTALSINHARSIRVFRTTGTMHHAGCNRFVKQWMSFRIRYLSRYNAICLCCIVNFLIWLQKNKEVHMRKATLLKFDGVNRSNNITKQSIFNFL